MDWSRTPQSAEERQFALDGSHSAYQLISDNRPLESQDEFYWELGFKLLSRLLLLEALNAAKRNSSVEITRRELEKERLESEGVIIAPDWKLVTDSVVALRDVGSLEIVESSDDLYVVKLRNPPDSSKLEAATPKEPEKDLEHSVLFDIHMSSDHPEANEFIDAIYARYFTGGNTKIRKKHVKVILLHLFVTWKQDPSLVTAISRDAKAYNTRTRYNELKISRMTPVILDALIEVGLVEQRIGFHDDMTGIGYSTRIWPTKNLLALFEAAKFGPLDIGNSVERECIILRKEIAKKTKLGDGSFETDFVNKNINYVDNTTTRRMRAEVTAYNELLRRTFVDIPILDAPFIAKDEKKGLRAPLMVSQRDKFVRRIFNRGSWQCNGRFWGGWWQRCPKEWRKHIFINDQATMEVDYSGHHVGLLYAREGIDYWKEGRGDPYEVSSEGFEYDADAFRAICKSLVLVALNAKDDKSTFAAFRYHADKGSSWKRLRNNHLAEILSRIKMKHKPIAEYFGADMGIDLMYQDSQIAAAIINSFTAENVPVLAIHDSFIVNFGAAKELEKRMKDAVFQVTQGGSSKPKEGNYNPFKIPGYNISDINIEAQKDAVLQQFLPQSTPRYSRQLGEFRKHHNLPTSVVEYL